MRWRRSGAELFFIPSPKNRFVRADSEWREQICFSSIKGELCELCEPCEPCELCELCEPCELCELCELCEPCEHIPTRFAGDRGLCPLT